jgi:integrase
VAWIREKFTVEALAGLNGQARDVLLAMVNTGCRPSEIYGLLPNEIRLDDNIPHIIVRSNEARALKTTSSERVVPLCGVSLEAMRRNPNGFPRYAGKDRFSDTVNKFLRHNGSLETPDHSAYSLRHSFEDRMLALNVPDRLAAGLMGHSVKRERYGAGPSLDQLADVVQRLAI